MDPLSPYSSDPSFTLENVTKTMATVDEDTLDYVLNLPGSKRGGGRSEMIDYFFKYSQYASWSDLASSLYSWEQHAALSAAREFIKRTTGMCVYVHSIV